MQLFPRPPMSQDESHFKAGLRHRDRNKKEFDLGLAVDKQLLQAFRLAPDWAWLYKTICKLAG